MRIYLDTNIIMDVFVGESRENYHYSTKILNAIKKDPGLLGLFSVQSLTDVSFSQTKYNPENRKEFYKHAKELLSFLILVTISPTIANESIWAEPSDFEDHEQILCAEDNDCSYFITGDKKILKRYRDLPGRISVISPKEYLESASQQKKD